MSPSPYMTAAEVIAYLRLDAEGSNAHEKLRNLRRRHQLPALQRGPVTLFERAAVDRWLAGERPTKKTRTI